MTLHRVRMALILALAAAVYAAARAVATIDDATRPH
jgi:hypothetical protein